MVRRRQRWRAATAVGATLTLLCGGLGVMAPAHAAAAACKVVYKKNDWGSGFTTSIDITNQGDALDGRVGVHEILSCFERAEPGSGEARTGVPWLPGGRAWPGRPAWKGWSW